jgi:aspartokinase-like uncharacterized kinase
VESVSQRILSGPGFVDFEVDLVIKFGGSLLADFENTRRFLARFSEMSAGKRRVVFPGGGPADKLIERIARDNNLLIEDVCPACLRAIDQSGILLCAADGRYSPATSLREVRMILDAERIPVLLPSRMILDADLFTYTDTITSDTLGAYFAFLMGASLYAILTDVDGVYEGLDTSTGDRVNLISSIDATDLAAMGLTSVDRSLSPFVAAVGLPTWVGNGTSTRALERYLAGEHVGTRILV